MDRKYITNFILVPFTYFSFLSIGMILVCGYLLTTSKGPIKSFAKEVNSDEINVNLSKDVNQNIVLKKIIVDDPRANAVDLYFSKQTKGNSPLIGYGKIFVREADKNQIDWRLLPAIAIKESNAAMSKTAKATQNPFGWGFNDDASKNNPLINTNDSYEQSIIIVSKKMRESYYDKGLDEVNEIVSKYNPGSVVRANGNASYSTWATEVNKFIEALNDIYTSK